MIIDFRVRPPFSSNVRQQTFRSMFTATHVENVWTRYREPIPSWDQHSVELMVQEMNEAGVDVSVLMGRVTEKNLDASCDPNGESAALIAQYPNRFVGFAAVDPLDPQAVDKIRYWTEEKGFKGISMDPGWSTPALYADACEIEPIYDYCEKHGIPVGVTQSGLMGPDMSFSEPVRIQRIATRHPELNLVIPHACWPHFHNAIFLAMACSNVYLIPDAYFYTKGMPMVQDFVIATNYHIKHNVLFATSYPLCGFTPCLEAWRNSGLNEEAVQLTLGENAVRILRL